MKGDGWILDMKTYRSKELSKRQFEYIKFASNPVSNPDVAKDRHFIYDDELLGKHKRFWNKHASPENLGL